MRSFVYLIIVTYAFVLIPNILKAQDIIELIEKRRKEIVESTKLSNSDIEIITELAKKAGLSGLDHVVTQYKLDPNLNVVYKVFDVEKHKGDKEIIQKSILVKNRNISHFKIHENNTEYLCIDNFCTDKKISIIHKCQVKNERFISILINRSDFDCNNVDSLFTKIKFEKKLIPDRLFSSFKKIDFHRVNSLNKHGIRYRLTFKNDLDGIDVIEFLRSKKSIVVIDIFEIVY